MSERHWTGRFLDHRAGSVAAGLVAGAVVFLGVWLLADFQAERYVEHRRAQVVDRASVVRARLEGALNIRLHLVRGL
ncbi:MAG: hypothetical protein DRQ37_06285, partial [Gammaproteobacteria bacterium]